LFKDDHKEENLMSIIKNIEKELKEARSEELKKAVDELRKLGDELEACDPHFFEEEKFEQMIKEVRRIVKRGPKIQL